MTTIKTTDYISSTGKVFPRAEMVDVCAVLGKAMGAEIGRIIVLKDGGVLLCPPKASAKPEPKVSKGPANEGVSATDMMAQMQQMMAAFQQMMAGGQAKQEAPKVPAGLNLGQPVKGRGKRAA